MEHKNKICLILPYYGDFPNYFSIWLESASKNKDIDYYIITNSNYPYPTYPNIFLVHRSLSDIRNKLISITGHNVKLEKPYKLCDYKPAYGLIFEDIVAPYIYWGWCDPDIIWGDLNTLSIEETFKDYDVIGGGGAFTILKNIKPLKEYIFYQNRKLKSFSFYEACFTNHNLIFDEYGAVQIRKILKIRETSQYEWLYKKVLDIIPPAKDKNRPYPLTIRFYNKPLLIEYKEGHIWGYSIDQNGGLQVKEYAYCHLQKRKIDIFLSNSNHFIIYNELFLPAEMKSICLNKLKEFKPEKETKNKKGKTKKLCMLFSFLKDAKYSLLLRILRQLRITKNNAY